MSSEPAPEETDSEEPRLAIPLPGGRVACVPLSALESYVDADAKLAHPAGPTAARRAALPVGGGGPVTINIYASGPVRAGDSDVSAHHLAVDGMTGVSDHHTHYEYGECVVTDEAGFPSRFIDWHCHPLGTEYAELMR